MDCPEPPAKGLAAICRSAFCSEIGPAAYRTLSATAQVVHLGADREISGIGRTAGLAGVVLGGILRLQRIERDGRRQILGLAFAGDMIGQDMRRRIGTTLETASPVTLCRFDPKAFQRLAAEDRTLRQVLYRHRVAQLERLRWLTWAIGALHADERVAAFIAQALRFMPVQPLPDGTKLLTLSICRHDIADLLVTTVETVSRALGRLEVDGLIRLRDPEHVEVLDLPGLAARAGQDDKAFEPMTSAARMLCARHAAMMPVNAGRGIFDQGFPEPAPGQVREG